MGGWGTRPKHPLPPQWEIANTVTIGKCLISPYSEFLSVPRTEYLRLKFLTFTKIVRC